MIKIEFDPQIFKTYYQSIKEIYSTGDNTEYSFRTPFETFLKSLGEDITVLQEQRRVAGLGAPDFKAFRGAVNVGYIETKDIGAPLDEVLGSDQIKKYVNSIDNLILTNYCRFILLRKGQTVLDFNLFNVSDLSISHYTIPQAKIEAYKELAENFFGYKSGTIDTGEQLARELSKKAKLLRDIAAEQLKDDQKRVAEGETPSPIFYFYKGLAELITDISIPDSADAYAQTITYGLFLARKKIGRPSYQRDSSDVNS